MKSSTLESIKKPRSEERGHKRIIFSLDYCSSARKVNFS